MKRLLRRIFRELVLDGAVVPVVSYVSARCTPRATVEAVLARRASEDAASYAEIHMGAALHFPMREQLWDFCLRRIPDNGLVAEFGVWNGYSANYFAKQMPARTIFGFDSFEGLHVDWHGTSLPKGSFDRAGAMPKVRKNVSLVKGWFHETLPIFFERVGDDPFAFVHIDCDTYEATRTVLQACRSRLLSGTIIVFDEYFGFIGWRRGEHLAWTEFCTTYGIAYEYLAFSDSQVAVRIE